jgi:hypothetical protein
LATAPFLFEFVSKEQGVPPGPARVMAEGSFEDLEDL